MIEPVIGLRGKIGHGMLREKFPRDAFRRRFVGDGLYAVFAKLGEVAVIVRARPRAALTIEPLFLVEPQQLVEAAHRAHLAHREAHRLQNGGQASSDMAGFGKPDVAGVVRRLRSGRRERVRSAML